MGVHVWLWMSVNKCLHKWLSPEPCLSFLNNFLNSFIFPEQLSSFVLCFPLPLACGLIGKCGVICAVWHTGTCVFVIQIFISILLNWIWWLMVGYLVNPNNQLKVTNYFSELLSLASYQTIIRSNFPVPISQPYTFNSRYFVIFPSE